MTDVAPGWDLYRSFLAVLEQRSLSGAARMLGLTQPTIGRHVDALEQALGMALFTRSQHGLLPTEDALELRPYAETMRATTEALLRAASGRGAGTRGTVRITASEMIGVEVLPPILAGLRRAYPELMLELVVSNRNDDLLRHEADIAVRMVPPRQEALLARRIGVVELGLFAHGGYLERCGTPATLAALAEHSLMGFDREPVTLPGPDGVPIAFSRERFALRTDCHLAHLAAIRAGFGIGVCQAALAARSPALVRVLPQAFSVALEVWVVMHEDLRASRRCRVVFDALAAGLAIHAVSDRKHRVR